METNNTNLQAAVSALNANVEAINSLRAKFEGTNITEAAQLLLIDKFQLSQTEAAEIVDAIKSGLDSYRTMNDNMAANGESAVRESIATATVAMSAEERTRYLASMLSALELASATDVDQAAVDARIDANMAKSEAELMDSIVVALGSLPVGALTEAANDLDAEAVQELAAAIEKNSDDYRFMAALQLYIAQREGTFKGAEGSEPLNPQLIGALAAGAVDAMLATSNLKAGKIDLTKWQSILKNILGVLFVIACTVASSLGLILLSLPIMGLIWSIFGTGFAGFVFVFLALVPLARYGGEYSAEATMWLVEKLDPIYDKVITKLTTYVQTVYACIKNWVLVHYSKAATKAEAETEEVEEINEPTESLSQDQKPLPA